MKRIRQYALVKTIAVPALLVMLYVALDYIPRYLSWYNLSHDEIREKALNFSNGQPVCLYVVDCSTDVARLELIRDETELDTDRLKSVFWKRRFEGYCEGHTEDIVIDIPDNPQSEGRKDDARWSFFNDRFITNHGRFQGSAGSFYPFEECTINDVLWRANR